MCIRDRATSANSLRIEAPIPGTSYVGVEIPNEDRETVYAREILSDEKLLSGQFRLPLGIGINLKGEDIYTDLQKMPHILAVSYTHLDVYKRQILIAPLYGMFRSRVSTPGLPLVF